MGCGPSRFLLPVGDHLCLSLIQRDVVSVAELGWWCDDSGKL